MNNEAAELRLKAEACQRLADLTGTQDLLAHAGGSLERTRRRGCQENQEDTPA